MIGNLRIKFIRQDYDEVWRFSRASKEIVFLNDGDKISLKIKDGIDGILILNIWV